MPNIKSAKKRVEQTAKKQLKNYSRKHDVKTAVKKVLDAVADKDLEQAKELMRKAQAKLARAKSKGVMHANAAARKMSRMAKRISSLEAHK